MSSIFKRHPKKRNCWVLYKSGLNPKEQDYFYVMGLIYSKNATEVNATISEGERKKIMKDLGLE